MSLNGDKEILFYSATLGKEMMLKNWEGEPWFFYKHPDGQWVSYRKASERDVSVLIKMQKDG